jgi:putative GTP pyrophosphokinase
VLKIFKNTKGIRYMPFVKPKFSKGQINRAGEILAAVSERSFEDVSWAGTVLGNFRACHGYPINTFQATLRQKLLPIDSDAIVAQRLKRAPSILQKLQRFDGMQLARMQDIGGLRAIVKTVKRVKNLEDSYRTANFRHELVSSKDYLNDPKSDGYRGIHLIYRYSNPRASEYNGLSLELQIRTRLQHAWATAVETMGTFLGQALKSGQGEDEWRKFFSTAGAALAIVEKTASVPGFERKTDSEVFTELATAESNLHVLEKLRGFAIAADSIKTERGQGAYHLIVLDSANLKVSIRPFSIARLEEATQAYAQIETRTKAGEPVEAVLVSAGPVEALRKAYPNYFLDTQVFVNELSRVISSRS